MSWRKIKCSEALNLQHRISSKPLRNLKDMLFSQLEAKPFVCIRLSRHHNKAGFQLGNYKDHSYINIWHISTAVSVLDRGGYSDIILITHSNLWHATALLIGFGGFPMATGPAVQAATSLSVCCSVWKILSECV